MTEISSFSFEIKICGITREEDALAALEAGADYLGFVFYPRSPRAVTPAIARRIVDSLGVRCKAVGVFVNERPEVVERTAIECSLSAVQLHGDEGHEDFRSSPRRIWRALWLRAGMWVPDPAQWHFAERYVVDAAPPGMYGGSGNAGHWEDAALLAAERRIMLAGGLTPANVGAAIAVARPAGVDVVSGVESAPGRKDKAKVFAFVREARLAAEKLRGEAQGGKL